MDATVQKVVMMDQNRIRRSLNRMAHEIMEKLHGESNLAVVGINRRGLAVAEQLAALLSDIGGHEVQALPLDVDEETKGIDAPDLAGRRVLLVDDVIFSGETMFRALRMLSKKGLPAEVRIAALVDRGHRLYPLEAQFAGMSIPTKLKEHVAVEVEAEGMLKAVVLHRNG